MIHFVEYSDASKLHTEHTITKIIVPLAIDTMADCQLYKTVAAKYPELDTEFSKVISGKNLKPGDYLRVQLSSGQTIFFIIIRAIEKFQPYIFDITKAVDCVMSAIQRETAQDQSSNCKLLFPLQSSDELKLSDTILIPTLCEHLMFPNIDVFLLIHSDYEQYIEKIEDTVIYYKRDSWKSDWMLTLDDILLLDILANVIILCHDFKINKSNLIKAYYLCHQKGMFPKFEFYQTEFGQFFKHFLPKSNSLINHGLLLNTHHYSNAEPKKFSCIIGPMFPHLKHLAYSQIMRHRDKTSSIVQELKTEHINAYKNKPEDSYRQKPQVSFSL